MARMKGNRGAAGVQLPSVEVPLRFATMPPPPPKAPRRTRRATFFLLGAAAIVLGFSAGLTVWLVERGDSNATAEPVEPPTPLVQPSATPTTPATPPATATASSTPAASPSATPTPTLTPASTVTPTPSPTANPLAPPAVRMRYVVQPGDSCDGLRIKFHFANGDFLDFQTALTGLTGWTAATRCVMHTGDVLCIPSQADLAHPEALKRDDVCLKG
jgi:hypothetical protein